MAAVVVVLVKWWRSPSAVCPVWVYGIVIQLYRRIYGCQGKVLGNLACAVEGSGSGVTAAVLGVPVPVMAKPN